MLLSIGITLTALAALLPAISVAAPTAISSGPAFSVTAAQLIAIAPKSASCPASPQFPNECQTAAAAAPAINWGFAEYGITTPGEAAGLVAMMASESGDFEFAVHHFPSPNPGQGTRNMQGPKFNVEYAQSLPALQASLPAGLDPAAVLALLVANIDYDFASAAWFLTTQCDASVRDGLKQGGLAGFTVYVGCIRASMTDDLTAYYTAAAKVFGVGSS